MAQLQTGEDDSLLQSSSKGGLCSIDLISDGGVLSALRPNLGH